MRLDEALVEADWDVERLLSNLIPDEDALMRVDLDGMIEELNILMEQEKASLNENIEQLIDESVMEAETAWPMEEMQSVSHGLKDVLKTNTLDIAGLNVVLKELSQFERQKECLMHLISNLEKSIQFRDSCIELRTCMSSANYARMLKLVVLIDSLSQHLRVSQEQQQQRGQTGKENAEDDVDETNATSSASADGSDVDTSAFESEVRDHMATLLNSQIELFEDVQVMVYEELERTMSTGAVPARETRRASISTSGDSAESVNGYCLTLCSIIDIVKPGLKDDIINTQIETKLSEYSLQFQLNQRSVVKEERTAEALKQINTFQKRELWLTNAYNNVDYKALFPSTWNLTEIFLHKFCSVTRDHLVHLLDMAFKDLSKPEFSELISKVTRLEEAVFQLLSTADDRVDTAKWMNKFSLLVVFNGFTQPWITSSDKMLTNIVKVSINTQDDIELLVDASDALPSGCSSPVLSNTNRFVPKKVFKSSKMLIDTLTTLYEEAKASHVSQMLMDYELLAKKYMAMWLQLGWRHLACWKNHTLSSDHELRLISSKLIDWGSYEAITQQNQQFAEKGGRPVRGLETKVGTSFDSFTDLVTLIGSLELFTLCLKKLMATQTAAPRSAAPSVDVPRGSLGGAEDLGWIKTSLIESVWKLKHAAVMTLFRHFMYSTFVPLLPPCYDGQEAFVKFLTQWQQWMDMVQSTLSPALSVVVKDTTVLLYCRYVQWHTERANISKTSADQILLDANSILTWITADSSVVVSITEINMVISTCQALLAS